MNSSPVDVHKAHEAAFQLFQAGRFAAAEVAYRSIVECERGNAEAWNMLGIALQRQGDTAGAIDALQTAMDVAPRAPEIVVNLGNIYKESGEFSKAIRIYRRALGLDSRHAMAHANLAACLIELGELDLAETHARQALTVEGQSLEAWSALAGIAERRCDFAKAIEILTDMAKRYPDRPDVQVHLGCVASLAKCYALAIESFQRALALRPGFVEAMNNLGQALFELGRLEEADDILQAALRIQPDMKELHVNLANVRIAQRRHTEALACFARVFELDPESASSHFVCGMVHLVEGDFENGWREYEWRWRTEKYQPQWNRLTVPAWQGQPLDGKTLFVHVEQGIGDTLQFVRYLPLIEKTGGRIVLEVQPPLSRLMATLPALDSIVVKGEELPNMDFHVPLLNIPGIMGTDLDSIPRQTPYLGAEASLRMAWCNRLATLKPGLRVGLAWAGNPEHANDHNRSMCLTQLAPLSAVAGVQWISLQKGAGAEQIQSPPPGLVLTDWTSDLDDFAATAALIECLDLVLAVDTSVVHLAGALNKPVWVMIPFAPDWRWLLERTDSPWYPGMRLFRQNERGNWRTVIETVVQELAALTNSASASPT